MLLFIAIAAVLAIAAFTTFSSTADDDAVLGVAGEYNIGDIGVVNKIIENNGLDWDPSPADGSTVDASWTGVTWSGSAGDTNRRITALDVYNRGLTGSLDVSGLTELNRMYCDGNNLSALDISKNTALTQLTCYENNLSVLDVSNNVALVGMYCYGNNLSALDVSKNVALLYLDCNNNNLSALDVSKNTALVSLYCDKNNLSVLDVSKNTALEYLYCHNNNLTELNVTKNTALEYLWVQNNCIPSKSDVMGFTGTWDGSFFRFDPQRTNVSFVATQAGGTSGTANSTGIVLTFSESVSDLTAGNITITDGTGAVTKGTLSGTGTTWTIGLTNVATQGNVTVAVGNFGTFNVTTPPQTVTVFKDTPAGGISTTTIVVIAVVAIAAIAAVAYVFVIRPKT